MNSASGRFGDVMTGDHDRQLLDELDNEFMSPDALRPKLLSFALPGAVGVLLWSYVCASPLEIELASKPSRPGIVLIFLLPLLALGAGLALRRPLVTMLAFPLSLLPCLGVLQPLDLASLNTLSGGLLLAGGLTLFLLVSARLAPERTQALEVRGERLLAGVDPRFWRELRHTAPRLVLMLALLIVPLTALYSDGGQEKLVENFGSKRVEAALLIHTTHLFIFAMAAYLFFLSPAINKALEQHELKRRLRAEFTEERQRFRRRLLAIFGTIALALVALFAWLL